MRVTPAALLLVAAACSTARPAERKPRPAPAKAARSVEPRAALPAVETASTAPRRAAPSSDEARDLEAVQAEVRAPEARAVACADAPTQVPRRREGLVWPVDGAVVASFGKRDGHPHEGIDIAAPVGTAVVAADDGEVLFAGERPGYGRLLLIAHSGDRVTVYAHNAVNCVADGAKVRQGELVALVGESGDASSPSLHFEVRIGQQPQNPRKHLPDER